MPTEFVEVPADLECILLVAALAFLVIFAHHIEVRISTRMTPASMAGACSRAAARVTSQHKTGINFVSGNMQFLAALLPARSTLARILGSRSAGKHGEPALIVQGKATVYGQLMKRQHASPRPMSIAIEPSLCAHGKVLFEPGFVGALNPGMK